MFRRCQALICAFRKELRDHFFPGGNPPMNFVVVEALEDVAPQRKPGVLAIGRPQQNMRSANQAGGEVRHSLVYGSLLSRFGRLICRRRDAT
jgi:hypothetical protein